MIGTIVNTAAIVAGTLLGTLFHRGIGEKYRQTLYNALGLASLGIGLNAFVQNMPRSQQPVLFILAMAIGALAGTALDVDGRFRRAVDRHSSHGADTHRPRLADGLATAILLYCVGPLSMLGPVMSALRGDHTFLYTNATLDFVSSTIFAATYGAGMLLAAPVLFCWQGLFYATAILSSNAVSDQLMAELLIVGGLLITASGLSLLRLKDCHVLNLLPALLVPVAWFLLRGAFGLLP